MAFSLSKRSIQRRAGVDPRLIEISDLAMTLTVVDFGIPRDGGLRTAQRQHDLFNQNLSKCDGYKNPSPPDRPCA